MDERTPGIRPRPSFWRRLDVASRHAAPMSIAVIMLLVSAAPLGMPGRSEIQVAIALASVYFWSLFRPASMNPPLVFVLGVLLDLVGYAAVGAGVVMLLMVHGVAFRFRRLLTRQGFLVVWLAFAGVACLAAILQWALTAALSFRLPPPENGVFQAMLAIGLYPALATLLGWAHRTLAEPDHA